MRRAQASGRHRSGQSPFGSSPAVVCASCVATLGLAAMIALGSVACAPAQGAESPSNRVDSESDGLACVESALRADPPEYVLAGAERHFGKRCEQQNEPGACSALGVMHELGRGVDKDVSRAAALYERACGQGHARACLNLGRLYSMGQGVEPQAFQAGVLFDLACRGDNWEACHELAIAHFSGAGVEQSATRAVKLLERGCAAEHTGSCVDLGELFERGQHVARDSARAERLYAKACRGGDTAGCFKLDQIALANAGARAETNGSAARLVRAAQDQSGMRIAKQSRADRPSRGK